MNPKPRLIRIISRNKSGKIKVYVEMIDNTSYTTYFIEESVLTDYAEKHFITIADVTNTTTKQDTGTGFIQAFRDYLKI